jgi:hypothetical protein
MLKEKVTLKHFKCDKYMFLGWKTVWINKQNYSAGCSLYVVKIVQISNVYFVKFIKPVNYYYYYLNLAVLLNE